MSGQARAKPLCNSPHVPERVVVGKISGVFGVRGWVRVFSYTEPRENILHYEPWLLGSLCGDGSSEAAQPTDDWQTWRPARGRRHGKGLVVCLDGCAGREQALALVGLHVAVRRTQLPPTRENEFYWADLIGLVAQDTDGVRLGRVERLFETGANDVMVVGGERQRLIPYIWGRVVKRVDLEGGVITVDWDAAF